VQYHGRVYDPGTGFHDYGARMYWPQIGRFISADSFQGSIANPASLNRYSYVLNNPYRYVDPTGQAPHTAEELMDPGERWADKPTIEQRAAAQAAEWLAGQSLNEANSTGVRVMAAVPGAVIGMLDHEHMATTLCLAGSIKVPLREETNQPGSYRPPGPLPRDPRTGRPVPDSEAPHTQIGTKISKRTGQPYTKAREFGDKGQHVRDVDFTDHGRADHPNPHEHRIDPQTGKRGPPQAL
jgi:RHS repeat-associated protein